MPGAQCVLGVGLVGYFKRKNSQERDAFLVLTQDMQSYHYIAAQLHRAESSGSANNLLFEVSSTYLFTEQNIPSTTHDIDDVQTHLAALPRRATKTPQVLVHPSPLEIARKPLPKQDHVNKVAAQKMAKTKLELRLQQLEAMENDRCGGFVKPIGGNRHIISRPPSLKRPAAAGASVPASPANQKKPKAVAEPQPVEQLGRDTLSRHKKQKVEQKQRLLRVVRVEGFKVNLHGSVTTQRKKNRAYDAVEVKITDVEMQERFLRFQQGGDVELLCRARKQCHRFFAFDDGEEAFAEQLGLLWAARTRWLLFHGKSYDKNRTFTNDQVVQARSSLTTAIRPYFARATELAAGNAEQKKQLRKLATVTDECLKRMDMSLVGRWVDEVEV